MPKDAEIHDESIKTCRRCGTCCRKGGPALHRQDRPLVVEGHLPAARLYTIRRGETVRDDVAGGALTAADGDIIKVRDRAGGGGCVFYDETAAACTIYPHRPLECRVMRCWDTGGIEAVYDRDRLGRGDLLAEMGEIRALVADHERRCAAGQAVALADRRRALLGPAPRLDRELLEMVRYDAALRRLMVEQAGLDAGLLDFLLGRPLTVVLRPLGIAVDPVRGRVERRR